MYKTIKSLGAMALATCMTHGVLASTLTITNDNSKELTVVIDPKEHAFQSSHELKYALSPKETKKITLSKEQLNGQHLFNVKGGLSLPIPSTHKTCEALHVDKDYTLIFTEEALGGTNCMEQK